MELDNAAATAKTLSAFGNRRFRHNKITPATPGSTSSIRRDAKKQKMAQDVINTSNPSGVTFKKNVPGVAKSELKTPKQIVKARKIKEIRKEKNNRKSRRRH